VDYRQDGPDTSVQTWSGFEVAAMTKNTVVSAESTNHTGRLHYLDWLRVILILGVFVYHAIHPFIPIEWHINNEEQSVAILVIALQFFPWGMPLFFLISGAGSMFALRRRTDRQYIGDRVTRLLIPFVIGTILLSPIQSYLEALHKATFDGSFVSFIPEWIAGNTSRVLFSPHFFGRWGYHLWFLGFLFSFSLLALPLFRWFNRDSGRLFILSLAGIVGRRGGILLFILPLSLSRSLLQPFFPGGHGWVEFTFSFLFFVSGFILFFDDRFMNALRRDRWIVFMVGISSLIAQSGIMAITGGEAMEWVETFLMPWSIILNILYSTFAWCAATFVLFLATKGSNRTNKYLEYGNEIIVPFYLLHQPVIVAIAYFVVQWDSGIVVKLPVLMIGSLLISLGLVELVRRIKPVRSIFGMKSGKHKSMEGS
jgi:glucans biosynthesis protein C